jgi:hypothetical protein
MNNWFLEKRNKIDKTLAKLTKRRREVVHINKTKDEKGR